MSTPPYAGYPRVNLKGTGTEYVHRLVMLAFVGKCPDGLVVRHLDGDSTNNHLSNLTYGTQKENGEDKVKHGRTVKLQGENHHLSKLTAPDVLLIRLLGTFGWSQSQIARVMGIAQPTARNVLLGITWSHI